MDSSSDHHVVHPADWWVNKECGRATRDGYGSQICRGSIATTAAVVRVSCVCPAVYGGVDFVAVRQIPAVRTHEYQTEYSSISPTNKKVPNMIRT